MTIHCNRPKRSRDALSTVVVGLAVLAAACSSDGVSTSQSTSTTTVAAAGPTTVLGPRLNAINEAINSWQAATDISTAHRFAETARNLIVGADGPLYGDADGDGTIEGASAEGLLPGLAGQPGIATDTVGPCVTRDILGGSWADPTKRWADLQAIITAWSPSNNQFPTLASHPQRIVGWATLTLNSTSLADAVEYGGHAHLHIDVSEQAVNACDG